MGPWTAREEEKTIVNAYEMQMFGAHLSHKVETRTIDKCQH